MTKLIKGMFKLLGKGLKWGIIILASIAVIKILLTVIGVYIIGSVL